MFYGLSTEGTREGGVEIWSRKWIMGVETRYQTKLVIVLTIETRYQTKFMIMRRHYAEAGEFSRPVDRQKKNIWKDLQFRAVNWTCATGVFSSPLCQTSSQDKASCGGAWPIHVRRGSSIKAEANRIINKKISSGIGTKSATGLV
jgi:hypothetical protein